MIVGYLLKCGQIVESPTWDKAWSKIKYNRKESDFMPLHTEIYFISYEGHIDKHTYLPELSVATLCNLNLLPFHKDGLS